VFISELKRLNETKCFVDRATHWQIVDGNLPKNAARIDDEQATEGDAFVLFQDAVVG
jgi:hypothetical protein